MLNIAQHNWIVVVLRSLAIPILNLWLHLVRGPSISFLIGEGVVSDVHGHLLGATNVYHYGYVTHSQ